MEQVTLTISLPADWYEQAQNAGILTDDSILELLQKEIERRKKVDRLFGTMEKLAQLQPPLTQEEIDAEIEAFKAESYQKNTD